MLGENHVPAVKKQGWDQGNMPTITDFSEQHEEAFDPQTNAT